MANTKTAKKQILVTKRNHERNLAVKSKLKTMMKRARAAIAAAEDREAADSAVSNAVKQLYKTATKGIIKKQNASRRVSRLMLSLNKAFAEGAVKPEAPAKAKKGAAKPAAKTAAKPKAAAPIAAPAAEEVVEAPVAAEAVEITDESDAVESVEITDEAEAPETATDAVETEAAADDEPAK